MTAEEFQQMNAYYNDARQRLLEYFFDAPKQRSPSDLRSVQINQRTLADIRKLGEGGQS